ncbi:MAG: YceI family protein [Proteobacteria bacterium]|nr:YceI family protein [Pseudomonadota bacterium]
MRTLFTAALLLAAGTAAAAPTYPVLATQSSLSFVATQQGEKFTGVIRDFDARVSYAPEDLAHSGLEATMRLKSIDTKSPDRDQAIGTADWFDVARYPTATFRTVAMRMTPTGPVADADLTIKGRTKRIAFPFAWKATAGGATLDARVALDRLDFGLGGGEWADESMVAHRVEVVVHLTLAAPVAAAPAKPAAH